MATCKNCGRQVSKLSVNGYGLCPQCAEENTKQERENLISLLGTGPVRCHVVMTDFITTPGITWVQINDLFVSAQSLVLIPLAGNIKQDFLNTQNHSIEARKNDYGLTIEDRIRNHGGVVIPKQDIISIIKGNNKTGLAIEYKGGMLALGNDKTPEYYDRLIEWQQGVLKEDADPQGANLYLGYPSVDNLVSWLTNGQIRSEVDLEKLTEIPSKSSYFQNVMRSFDKLNYLQKTACFTTILTLSADWVNGVRKYLDAKKQTVILTVIGLSFFSILIIGGGILLVANHIFYLGVMLILFIFLGLALFLIISSIKDLSLLLKLIRASR